MKGKMIIAGNWKMHTDAREAGALIDGLVAWCKANPVNVTVVVAPPFPFLADAVQRVAGARAAEGGPQVLIAAQNCHEAENGAFTGEVSVPMLKSLGVDACIVGHSERRQYFGENDPAVAVKVALLLKHGLMPIYCCGERLEERREGRHQEVVAAQLTAALGSLPPQELARMVVAYEPVWAIGTGLTASPDQAQDMHAFIRGELHRMAGAGAGRIPVLYGGSCKPDNAAGLFAGADINGGLIGGAALSLASFTELVRIAHHG
ncbi:MAG: triose-phosphate isomerase [Flavobacteriales bacterium]|nr:triose-phosphate isomerase [Flavobacteriales bacterium]